jgi:chromosome segregation ATPase
LLNQAHGARVSAEEAAAEAQQRSEWEARRRRANEDLTAERDKLALIEQRVAALAAKLEEAEKKLGTKIDALREARRASLTEERDRVLAELGQARRERDAQSGASKHLRKEAARKVYDLEQHVKRLNRELDSLSTWSPPESELAAERAEVSRLREARERARDEAKAVSSVIRRLEQLASEPFAFAPPRLPAPAAPQEVAPPPVPGEAPPELGELFEHRGKRFLAVKTWEQVPRAIPVARRLNAKLVCLTDHDK